MLVWTPVLLLSPLIGSLLCLPLRPSDLGSRHGHIIHYHRDKHSQRSYRHIHYHPPVKRSHQTDSVNTFFRIGGTNTNMDAIYEVPSNRQFRREQTFGGRDLDVKVRSLVHENGVGGLGHQSPAKEKASTGSSITLHGETIYQPIVPVKSKIVRHPSFHDINRNYPVTTNVYSNIGKVHFLKRRRKQKPPSQLYNNNSPSDNVKAVNGAKEKMILDKNKNQLNYANNNLSKNVNKFMMGMFHPYRAIALNAQNNTLQQPINKDVSINTEVPVLSEMYQRSTAHSKPITKRRVHEQLPRTQQTLIDNILKIQIGDTTTLPSVTSDPVSDYIKTADTQATQIPITTARPDVTLDTKQGVGQISAKDFIHLKGIHIAFSNGQQNKSKTIPTIHLTASVSPPGSPSKGVKSIQSNNGEKIVGTAMIKNGHLYLVVYPFGENKSLDLMFQNDSSNIKLPHNKPISYTTQPATQPTTLSPSTSTTVLTTEKFTSASDSTTVQTTTLPPSSSTSEAPISNTTTTETLETTIDPLEAYVSDFFLNDFLLDTSTVANAHSEHKHNPKVRNVTLSIKHVERFFSPWRGYNLTNVAPLPRSKNNKSANASSEDETDIEILNFIANATDPFDQLLSVLDQIKNRSVMNNSTDVINDTNAEATFNFELKVQSNVIQSTLDPKQTSTQSIVDNSEEMTEATIQTTTELTKSQNKKIPSTREQSKMDSVTSSLLEEYLKGYDIKQGTPEPNSSFITKEMRTTTPVLTTVTEPSTPNLDKRSQFTDPATSSTENVHFFENTFGVQSTTDSLLSVFNKQQANTFATGTIVSTTTVAPQITLPSFNLLSALKPRHRTGTWDNAVNQGSPQEVKSLSDILSDIRRVQLHNMARFNIQNNNFGTMLARQSARQSNIRPPQSAGVIIDGPMYPDTSARRFASQNNNIHNNQQHIREQTAINNALDAMLVLSVDEFLSDHANLHGAIALASRSSSNNRQE